MRVLHERGLKGYFAIFIVLLVVMISVIPCNAFAAAGEARYEMRSGDTTFGNDLTATGQAETVFHQQTLTNEDKENLGITFPGEFGLNAAGGPGVDMVIPAITQTTKQSSSYTSTGFFTANLPFYPCCNYGAAPVGVGQFGKPSPVKPAKFRGSGLFYPEMVNSGGLKNQTGVPLYTETNINNTRITLPPPTAPQAYGEVAGIARVTVGGIASDPLYNKSDNEIRNNSYSKSNNTSNNASNSISMPLLLSSHRFNMNAPADEINNTSIMERMWRNSHFGHLMDIAYEGDSSYPTWIAPEKSPKDLLQRRDPYKVIGYSLNMTKPGEYLTYAFWDL